MHIIPGRESPTVTPHDPYSRPGTSPVGGTAGYPSPPPTRTRVR